MRYGSIYGRILSKNWVVPWAQAYIQDSEDQEARITSNKRALTERVATLEKLTRCKRYARFEGISRDQCGPMGLSEVH